MKTHANRNAKKRTFAQNLRATFGSIDLPLAGPRSLCVLGAACLLISGAASADWRVYDSRVEGKVDEVSNRIGNTSVGGSGGSSGGTVTGNQKQMFDQYTLGTYQSSGNAVEHPRWPTSNGTPGAGGADSSSPFKLENFKDMVGGPAGAGNTAMALQSNLGKCGAYRDQQKAICEEIVKTENAQFIYMVKFHEMAAERLERLDAIEQEREQLGEDPKNYGKLQDNTNKLLALNTRMSLDTVQMESAMNAYEARLAYLRALQAQKTTEALAGKSTGGDSPFGDIGDIAGALIDGATLKAALNGLQSDTPEGFRDMEWL